jgi:hypothetical protein
MDLFILNRRQAFLRNRLSLHNILTVLKFLVNHGFVRRGVKLDIVGGAIFTINFSSQVSALESWISTLSVDVIYHIIEECSTFNELDITDNIEISLI